MPLYLIIYIIVILGLFSRIVFALIPAKIAQNKDYSGALFLLFGIFSFVFALITALCLANKNPQNTVTVVHTVPQPHLTTFANNARITKLKQYKELLDSGIITQEEFDQKKKELLGF